jgi:hypothetical protein
MSGPKLVNPALVLAEAWQQQLLQSYWDLQVLLARCEMVGAALSVRDTWAEARFVVFEDSDQGDYAYLCGGTLEPGTEWSDHDYTLGSWEFDYDQADQWAPFLNEEFKGRVLVSQHYYLDIEKVLAEVPVPWQPVADV